MTYDPERHHRRSIRLREYDYAQAGAYFVTVVTQGRTCLFGDVQDGSIVLSEAGEMVKSMWGELPDHYPRVAVDAFTAMPNHVHGIIILVGAGASACPEPRQVEGVDGGPGRPQGVAPTKALSLPDVVHRFKSLTTARYRRAVRDQRWPPFAGRLWQRNYYEHVIRDEDDLDRVRRYIEENPLRWDEDPENPAVAPVVGDHEGSGDHGGSPLRTDGGWP